MDVAEATQQLKEALDALCAADAVDLGDGESVVDLHRQLARLDAVAVRSTAVFDASRRWAEVGARTAAAWITVECNLPSVTARRRVRLGRALRHMPGVEAQWLAGLINDTHVGLLAKARDRAPRAFSDAEADLVSWATDMRFRWFCRSLAYWIQRADPDGDEHRAARQHEQRRVNLSQSFEGVWFLEGVLDPIGGEIVSRALKAIETELFEADWAEAKDRVGESLSVADLARTPGQRRADALAEMARRAMAAPAGSRLPEPLVSILVGYETMVGPICELASGTVVSPAAVVRHLDAAYIERVVFDGPDRVMSMGRRRRLFRGAVARAVRVRDRECFHPYCDEPAEDCEIDHVQPYSAGGETSEANGRPGCAFHNKDRERRRGPPE